jgi:hypothetical protein
MPAYRAALALAVGLSLLVAAPPPAAAANDKDITVSISAVVEFVDDSGNLLGGAIDAGDAISGTYTYNAATPDENPAPTVGDYWHAATPYGIRLRAGGLVFETDPQAVAFLVEIVNDHQGSDNYLLRSYTNRPLSAGVLVEHISWQLDDPSQTALHSERLPTTAPKLARWQSIFGLDIVGVQRCPEGQPCPGDQFFIRARVTDAAAVRGR